MHSYRDIHDIWSHEIKTPNHIFASNNYFSIIYVLIVTISCCILEIKLFILIQLKIKNLNLCSNIYITRYKNIKI